MTRTFKTHNFVPTNPEKYIGSYPIVSRSSWEWDMMLMCDSLSTVLQWASEPVQIPYHDPVTGQQKVYVPDFLITFLRNREKVTQLIEIKPLKEALSEAAKSKNDIAMVARNRAKWEAAQAWCMRRGIEFEIKTEGEIFTGHPVYSKGKILTTAIAAVPKNIKPKVKKQRTRKAAPKAKKHSMKVPGVVKVSKLRRFKWPSTRK